MELAKPLAENVPLALAAVDAQELSPALHSPNDKREDDLSAVGAAVHTTPEKSKLAKSEADAEAGLLDPTSERWPWRRRPRKGWEAAPDALSGGTGTGAPISRPTSAEGTSGPAAMQQRSRQPRRAARSDDNCPLTRPSPPLPSLPFVCTQVGSSLFSLRSGA